MSVSRDAALKWLAVIATIVFLQWARALLIPMALAVVLSFAFNPLVRALHRRGISRYSGAFAVVVAIWAGGLSLGWALQDGAAALAAQLPAAAERIAGAVDTWRREGGDAMQRLREAATAIERATGDAPAPRSTPAVAVAVHESPWRAWLLSGSSGLLLLVGQLVTITFLVVFLLGSGTTLKRQWMRALGPSFGERRAVLRMVDAVGGQIQSALLVLLTTNVLFGLSMWIGYRALGLKNAEVWGAVAAVAHFVPYFGSGLIAACGALAAWMQTTSVADAVAAWAIAIVAATVIGTLVATWMQSRLSRLDPALVFVGLLFWGWLWGIAGLLLAMPLMAMGKVGFDHLGARAPRKGSGRSTVG